MCTDHQGVQRCLSGDQRFSRVGGLVARTSAEEERGGRLNNNLGANVDNSAIDQSMREILNLPAVPEMGALSVTFLEPVSPNNFQDLNNNNSTLFYKITET